MQGYIKLHRQLFEWEWYSDINVCRLFIHCLLRANHKEKKWQGKTIAKGSFITSYENLSIETGLTVRQVRTALDKLKMTGELTHKGQAQYSIITVNNWDKFQENDKQPDNLMTNERQTNDKQMTTNKNDKNDNNDKNDKKELLSTDPFFNPFKETFLNEFEKQTGKRPRLSYKECQKLIELSEEQTDLLELIPEAISKLKAIDFGDINYKPSANWLLKDNNFIRVLNGEFEKAEQKSRADLFLEKMRRETQ